MKKVLITGANGFLGKHIQERYKFNALLTPTSAQVNLLDFNHLSNYIFYHKPTHILHMAAVCAGILGNKNSPADFIRDNTQMGLNIYEAARLGKIKYVYSLGSICSYPKYCPIPFSEDDIWNGAPEETNFPYGQAKRTLLMLSQTYREQYGIKGAHLIPVNLLGPGDHFDPINSHVIPALIKKFIDGVEQNLPEVKCWGTGNASREFLYAGDCADAIIKAVSSDFDSPLPINLGTGKEITIKELAVLIKEITGYTGDIVFTGDVSDGQPRRCLNVERAKELLGWEATTSLTDGIKKTIEWYKNNRMGD